ncbi:MAG: DUF2178 domain-containing protein [Candidatus Omnitrophica bacterium]|nr:DUF2178 domain-containing protein [Candidatus Omnitrophota bacterium]
MDEMQTKIRGAFAIALFMLGIAIAVPVLGYVIDPAIESTFFSIASAMFAVGIVFYWKMKKGVKVVRDERVDRVARKASSWSWWFSYVLIALLFWVQYLKLYPLTVDLVLGIMFYFMIATYIVAQWFINRSPNA